MNPPIIDVADPGVADTASEPPPPNPPAPAASEALPPETAALVTTLCRGLAADADDHARAAAWEAGHQIARLLVPPPAAPAASVVPAAVASAVEMIRRVPAGQRLDVALGYLRAALPAGAHVPASDPLRIQLVPVPR
jgi:hypothetical protein